MADTEAAAEAPAKRPPDEKPDEQKAAPSEPSEKRNLDIPIAELLLTVLPLIVLIIVETIMGRILLVPLSPEWAFGASVLFGLAIFKLVISVVKGGITNWEAVGYFLVLLIVAGLVPSLVVLALRLSITEPPWPLIVTQDLLFVGSAYTFVRIAATSHAGLYHSVSPEIAAMVKDLKAQTSSLSEQVDKVISQRKASREKIDQTAEKLEALAEPVKKLVAERDALARELASYKQPPESGAS